jgi:hypothetical protein
VTLKEQIAVMQAFRDGAYIDSRPKVLNVVPSVWCENDTPGWNWSAVEYRIRPVPQITRQNLIDDIVSCSNNANDHGLADYHRYVTGSDVYPSDEGFEER